MSLANAAAVRESDSDSFFALSQMKDKLNGQELIVQLHDAVGAPSSPLYWPARDPRWGHSLSWGCGQVRDGDQKLVEYILQRRVDVNQRGQVDTTRPLSPNATGCRVLLLLCTRVTSAPQLRDPLFSH